MLRQGIIFVLAEFLLEVAEAWQPPPHIKKNIYFFAKKVQFMIFTHHTVLCLIQPCYHIAVVATSSIHTAYSCYCTVFSMGLDKHILTSQSQYKYKRPIVCVEIIYKMRAHVCITWHFRVRVSSCNIYVFQQDTQCGLNE